MKHFYWLLIVFIASTPQCLAQKEEIEYKEGIVYNGVRYKKSMLYNTSVNFSPLALVNTDNQVMVGIERRLGNNWAYAVDAGFVFSSYYINKMEGAKGFELRPAIRYYKDRHKREYFQAQVFYKMVDYKFHDWLGKDVVNRTPSYEKLQDFTFRKKVWSLSLMAGEIIPLSGNVFMEVYGGIGARYKEQAPTERNAIYFRIEERNSSIYDPKIWTVCAPVGVKLSLIIK